MQLEWKNIKVLAPIPTATSSCITYNRESHLFPFLDHHQWMNLTLLMMNTLLIDSNDSPRLVNNPQDEWWVSDPPQLSRPSTEFQSSQRSQRSKRDSNSSNNLDNQGDEDDAHQMNTQYDDHVYLVITPPSSVTLSPWPFLPETRKE